MPFVIYADFECLNEKADSLGIGKTQVYQEHRPCGFCFQIVCSFDEKIVFEPILFRAEKEEENVPEIFLEWLENEVRNLWRRFRKKEMILTEDKEYFLAATSCWICEEEFQSFKKKSGITATSLGSSEKPRMKAVIFPFKNQNSSLSFHNLSEYDSHVFIKDLAKTPGEIRAIANSEEKYISFSKQVVVGSYVKKRKRKFKTQEIRFANSFRFISSCESCWKSFPPSTSCTQKELLETSGK